MRAPTKHQILLRGSPPAPAERFFHKASQRRRAAEWIETILINGDMVIMTKCRDDGGESE